MQDVFTEKEKAIILKDYHRLCIEDRSFSCADRVETDVLLTEHPLDTQHNEDLPENQRNIQDRSVVLAPFNSLISLNDTLEDLPLVESHAIKYGKRVREINRVYEQNNNADLDNGVINEAIEQQELEEAALNEAS